MKKILACVLALTLCALCAFASAESFDWFEVDGENDTVLTVRLAANETTGYSWQWEIMEGSPIELVTEEYIPDEVEETEEPLCGGGGTFVASFIATAEGSGYIEFNYVAPGSEESADTYALGFTADAEGKITVTGVVIDAPSYDWCSISEDGAIDVSLPADTAAGYTWAYECSDDAALALLGSEYLDADLENCAENTYVASFWAQEGASGEQEIYFFYSNSEESLDEERIAYVLINDDGTIELQGMETISYSANRE